MSEPMIGFVILFLVGIGCVACFAVLFWPAQRTRRRHFGQYLLTRDQSETERLAVEAQRAHAELMAAFKRFEENISELEKRRGPR